MQSMKRFGLGGSSSQQSGAKEPKEPSIPQKKGSVSLPSAAMPNLTSISSIAMPTVKLTSLTKKIGAGLHIQNLTGDPDKKAKLEAEEKRLQISSVLAILEDVHLQCPQSHLGLIIAFTGTALSPIINPGIKYTWFRMKGEDQIDQVEETFTSWYPPCVDDIGCVICAQCEDCFEQQCSKYVECGPIKADSLMCSLAAAAVENGTYEVPLAILFTCNDAQGRDVFVSMGLDVAEAAVAIEEKEVSSSDTPALPTSLSKESAFVQLNGRSTIEVDDGGVFISIPTFNKPQPVATGRRGSAAGAGMKTSRRGLRIPANVHVGVVCIQPLSLVLTVPITHKAMPDSGPNSFSSPEAPPSSGASEREDGEETRPRSKSTESGGAASKGEEEEEARMKKFLTSSIVAIPWSYEGHYHSPEAYIVENEVKLSAEEKELLMRQAEEDSIIFANTVCSLAEFISALPEGTDELKICLTCPDRMTRDLLVLSVRALAAQPAGSTRPERMKAVFPWLRGIEDGSSNAAQSGSGEDGETLVAESNEFVVEMRKRLRLLEDENVTLKRERNELTVQLLSSREEQVSLKSKLQVALEHTAMTVSSPHIEAKEVASPSLSEIDQSHLGEEDYRKLSTKLIELENKVAISSKKEAESSKIRADMEARNSSLVAELEKFKKLHEDASRRAASMQALYDRQQQSIRILEDDQVNNKLELQENAAKLKELAASKVAVSELECKLTGLKTELEQKAVEHAQLQTTHANQLAQLEAANGSLEARIRSAEALQQQTESQLSAAIVENKRHEREIFALNEKVRQQETDIEQAKKLAEQLRESEVKVGHLLGEINSLQKKSDSQSRDLKKVMKENAMALSEFEKALIRKSEECNELYHKLNELKDAEAARQETESSVTAMFNKISTSLPTRGSITFANSSSVGESEKTATSTSDNALQPATSESSTVSVVSSAFGSFFKKADSQSKI